MKKAIITAAAVAFTCGGFAFADIEGDTFAAMDADGDAAVTEAEFTAFVTADGEITGDEASLQFAVLAGEDGVLLREEYDAVMGVKEDAADYGDTSSADPAETEGE
ncbi:MAG: RNA polymerase subunit sigma-70 [Pseudomonadota bacterium]